MSDNPLSAMIRDAVAEGIAVAVAQSDKRLLNLEDSARYLDVSLTTLRELVDAGELAVVQVTDGKRPAVRCCIRDLNQFIDGKRKYRAA